MMMVSGDDEDVATAVEGAQCAHNSMNGRQQRERGIRTAAGQARLLFRGQLVVAPFLLARSSDMGLRNEWERA
jgi:hypothetical protein